MVPSDFHARYFFLVLFVVGSAATLLLWPFFSSIVVAGVLAVLFGGVYRGVMRISRGRRIMSASVVCVLVATLLILPLLSLAWLVSNEVRSTYANFFSDDRALSARIDAIDTTLRSFGLPAWGEGFLSRDQLLGRLEQIGSLALNVVQALYIGATQFVIWLFVMFFTLFYFLLDGKALVARVMRLSPLADMRERELIRTFESMGRAILKGNLFIGMIQGFLGGTLLAVTGFSSPMTWGVVMVILSLIPFAGTGIVLFPACIWAFATGDGIAGITLLIGTLFIVTIDNYLRPKLVGRDTAMHPLLVFFSTLGGISLFGPTGFLIGPIVMALFLSLLTIYERQFGEELNAFNGRED